MKKAYIIIAVSCLFLATGWSQNETDALRYSQNFYGGTARSMSMGGAFGALGGDFTSTSLNPAGLGVYRSTELTLTPTLSYDNTSSRYLNLTSEDNNYRFILNNLGFVHTSLTGKDNGWAGVSFGLGYNQLNNFNRNTMMKGIQPSGGFESSSYLDNFTNNANAGEWSDYYEELAWNANLMPWDDSLNMEYWNDIRDAGYGQFQRRRITESGGIGEYVISVGANYGNRLYIGGTFGIHRLRYSSYIIHDEIDDAGLIPFFNSFSFRETLETRGTGYTFKAGIIYRPISLIRIGAAFHLPTFYNIREDFYTDMLSTFDDGTGEPERHERSLINQFDYRLRTPYKAIASVALQLGRLAIVSVDYEYMDYSKINMDTRPTSYDLLDQNDRIREIYSAAHNIRTGAELHLGPMYLRGGLAFYDSPYKTSEDNKNAWYMNYSGGFGIRSSNVFFDLAYVLRTNEYDYWLYLPEDAGGATISNHNQQISATLGFRF